MKILVLGIMEKIIESESVTITLSNGSVVVYEPTFLTYVSDDGNKKCLYVAFSNLTDIVEGEEAFLTFDFDGDCKMRVKATVTASTETVLNSQKVFKVDEGSFEVFQK